ncbi:MAG: hypothetical protein WD294_00075 [Phycisphaeraceae bacterium]
MNKKHLSGLIALNLVLLIALGALSLTSQKASAQAEGGAPEYLMVAGKSRGQISNSVYITDARNQLMAVVSYDLSRRALVAIAGRNLANDLRVDADR